ncbi:hypothetical protein GCM10022295_23070 [Streptomyces osmaniensis]|uniref:Uncharacterized protein n=1 Tax=Streptomyces osmaniensis TaxID=593134 RepID=A0ABP6VWB8_9ACTN
MTFQQHGRRRTQRPGSGVGQVLEVDHQLQGVEVRSLTVVFREEQQPLLQGRERKDFTDGGWPIQAVLLTEELGGRKSGSFPTARRFPIALTLN